MLGDGVPYDHPDDISSQLDVSRSFADLAPYLNFNVAQSRGALQQLDCKLDIRVGARDEERIDAFPASRAKSAIVIFIHGGWWHKMTRKSWDFVANGLSRNGFAVIVSDYALCPRVRIPDISQASRAAVAWAFEHADEINGDRDRIFLMGHSAGGQQAAMMAVTDWSSCGLPPDVLKGVVPMSGIFDMRPIKASYLQTYVQLTGETVLSESALFQIPDVAPPIQVMVAAEESREFHRQADLFVNACRKAGHRAEQVIMPLADHPTYVYELGDPDSPTCTSVTDFFRSC
jgi:arylformamidase